MLIICMLPPPFLPITYAIVFLGNELGSGRRPLLFLGIALLGSLFQGLLKLGISARWRVGNAEGFGGGGGGEDAPADFVLLAFVQLSKRLK